MATFAVMNDNTVENVILADDLDTAQAVTGKQCIEYTDVKPAGIGFIYDEANDIFITPEPTPSL